MINIAGITPVEDPSYRYKMPRIMGKVEGRGNGIKTLLVNVRDVATSLNREAPEICKFFGTELGAQTTYEADPHSGSGDRAIVNGAHRDLDLQQKLSTYIEKFVLCANCKLPETHYKIKDGAITQKCLACGHKFTCDMTHKLTTFILAQHKKAKADAKKLEKDGDKKDKKEKKEKKEKSAADGGADAEGGRSSSKEKKDKKDKKNSDADGGAEKEKKKKSSKEKKTFFDSDEAVGDAADDDESDSKAVDEAIIRFRAWSSDNAASTPEQAVEELRLIQIQHSLRPADRIIIFLGAVLTEAGSATVNQIGTHKASLVLLAPSAIQQRHLIAALEWFCGTKYPSLMRFFPLFLKQLFDEEIVEEDIFFNWATDYARNEYSAVDTMIHIDTLEAMKLSAAPFITWLQEAEEEGEEGEDDDEDDDDDDDDDDA